MIRDLYIKAVAPCPNGTVTITDNNGVVIGTQDVASGGVATFKVVDLPCASSPIGGSAMPMATGQTTSYADDDDGDTQRGRPFFTLPIIGGVQQLNHFGNKWRFTGINGGYYDRDTSTYRLADGTATTRILAYPSDLRCDWSTLDWNSNFLLWQMSTDLITDTFESCITRAKSQSIAGFSVWYIPNINELMTIRFSDLTISPFGIPENPNSTTSFNLWTSTPARTHAVTDAYAYTQAAANVIVLKKHTIQRSVQLRVTNISEL